MIAVDTNVVVRAIVRDNAVQAAAADAILSSGPVWLARSVLLETEWVLRAAYGLDRSTLNGALTTLVGLEGLVVDSFAEVGAALAWHQAGMDFADALHLASAGSCDSLATFDRRFAAAAARLSAAPDVTLVPA